MLYSLAGVIVGGIVTWVVAWAYYQRAANELRAEAESLHKATWALVGLVRNPQAAIELQADEKGRLTGVIVGTRGQL